MGRNNKRYVKTLEQQGAEKLKQMLHIGESKKEYLSSKGDTLDPNGDDTDGRIFSIRTYKNYWTNAKYFFRYMKKYHPEVTTLDKARKYVEEYLMFAEEEGKSAWTIQLYAKSLGKLYGITPESEDYVVPPVRKRGDIKRSRGRAKRDEHFNENTHYKLVGFCKGVGPRRFELGSIKKEDLFTKDQIEENLASLKQKAEKTLRDYLLLTAMLDTRLFKENYYVFIKGKGGRFRYAPVLEKYQEIVLEKFNETKPNEKVWKVIHNAADIHSYRSDYANAIYLQHARPLDEIPKTEINEKGKRGFGIYYTRGDEAGGAYDRKAMYITSKALGHNRVTVIAENYLRGI